MKVVITTSSFGKHDQSPLNELKLRNIEYILNPFGRQLSQEEVVSFVNDASGIIAGTELLSANVLRNLPKLKVISRCGTGTDNIDLEAAKNLGISVFNTPDAPALAVAELTIGFILDIMRSISKNDKMVKAGQWKKSMGYLLSDKKVGIIGFGRIGRKVAELLSSFNCQIHFTDPHVKDDISRYGRLSLQNLLQWSDIVTIHVSTKATILGKDELAMMKKGSWIVNVSRGGVIDEDALCQMLQNGHLTGAALDVFQKEPYAGPLSSLDNVILTPHIGSYALESRVNMEQQAVENLLTGLNAR